MGQTETERLTEVVGSSVRPLYGTQYHSQAVEFVTRTVWLSLPEVNPDVVYRLRRLYTRAIRRFIIRFQEENCTEKEIYHELRKQLTFSQLPARMLDRAGREAYQWLSHWKKERTLTDELLKSWVKWASNKGIDLRILQPGLNRIISYSGNLKGYPGSHRGQWPLSNLRLFVDSDSQDILVSIDRVVVKTRAVIGGKPAQLIHQALDGKEGHSLGAPRLIVRENIVYLAVPVTTKVNVPKFESLTFPTLVGVDLGINSLAAAVAISNDERVLPARVVSGKHLKHQLGRLWGKRRKASRLHKSEEIQALDKKTKRVIQHWIYTTANEIVRYATQFNQPIICLENLSNYQPTRERTPWAKPKLRDQLSKWARGEMGKTIQRTAALRDIPVIWVNAAYSSRICPRGCLCLLKGFSDSVFRCPACGVKLSRDINAAIELARRGKRLIEKMVKME
jgi:IS605 OrfB family transposase